ncbi:sigma-54 dependent transcriptional regulator [Candidatus Thiothrix sp. Deng01]|uniref:Sigma-54 dependent transcriptional regulator n=1 Tax=Candidatus Thiothrix phosphatis TaxID=3112415 RepID=A0ABU6CWW2_9GAMM|nr:sigma-54 dependent transcriptional regulator [Candidatus Thiothrix sp. Deng01]MEB4591326.1 sigma-54 dependent transcriptional regulator [Candidatus Thiothrix sp. Deng01]
MADTLLIIEDEQLLGGELQRHYRKQGFEVIWVKTCADARSQLNNRSIDPLLVLSDLNLPDGNSLNLLEEHAGRLNGCEWVFLTGYGDVPDSVRALRLGAFDFLIKPCPLRKLDMTLHSAQRSALAQRRLLAGSQGASQRYTPDTLIGDSPVTAQTRDMLRKLSQVPFSALILSGATGTGKGLAARILHYNGSRAREPLVELNCAALPKELLESELFGHEAGAFTGAKGRHRGLVEQAHRGTLFLDEIGEMPLDLQAKLLKVLEDHKIRRLGSEHEISVDIQVIAATNRKLQDEVRQGNFRADLFHRLSVFELRMPTLAERVADLRELAVTFMAEFNQKSGKHVTQVSESGWRMLESYPWPGNVRELRNVLERCVMLSSSSQLPEELLQLQAIHAPDGGRTVAPPPFAAEEPAIQSVPPAPAIGSADTLTFPLDGSMGLDDMDSAIICAMLQRYQGNVMEVARMLKTTREKIRYRIGKFRLR